MLHGVSSARIDCCLLAKLICSGHGFVTILLGVSSSHACLLAKSINSGHRFVTILRGIANLHITELLLAQLICSKLGVITR